MWHQNIHICNIEDPSCNNMVIHRYIYIYMTTIQLYLCVLTILTVAPQLQCAAQLRWGLSTNYDQVASTDDTEPEIKKIVWYNYTDTLHGGVAHTVICWVAYFHSSSFPPLISQPQPLWWSLIAVSVAGTINDSTDFVMYCRGLTPLISF